MPIGFWGRRLRLVRGYPAGTGCRRAWSVWAYPSNETLESVVFQFGICHHPATRRQGNLYVVIKRFLADIPDQLERFRMETSLETLQRVGGARGPQHTEDRRDPVYYPGDIVSVGGGYPGGVYGAGKSVPVLVSETGRLPQERPSSGETPWPFEFPKPTVVIEPQRRTPVPVSMPPPQVMRAWCLTSCS